MKIVKSSVLIITMLLAVNASAETVVVEGKIEGVKMFGNTFHIYHEALPEACGTGHKRMAIKTDHPLFNAAVSTALAGKATAAVVSISYYDQCTYNSTSWDFNNIYLK